MANIVMRASIVSGRQRDLRSAGRRSPGRTRCVEAFTFSFKLAMLYWKRTANKSENRARRRRDVDMPLFTHYGTY